MKNKFSAFDFVLFFGFVLILIAIWVGAIINGLYTLSEKLVSTGVWIIFSFFILSLTLAAIKGTPKNEINISKRYAAITFTTSGCLFLISAFIEYT